MAAVGGHAKHEAGMVVAASQHSSEVDVDALEQEFAGMVQQVRAVFMTGKTKSVEWRKAQIKAIRTGFVEQMDAICAALKADLGRHDMEGVLAEAISVIQEADHMLENIDDWVAPDKVWHPLLVQPGSSQIDYVPKGVVLNLAPWNYPINLAFMSMLAAISAGNCVVTKPSEVAPNCAAVIESIVSKYMDTECVKVVQGAVPETTALLRLPFDHIIYTGNGAVGRIVATAAAKHLTPITLELGGKSPTYVDKSCSLSVTAKRILGGKFLNNGQTCIAPDHILVHKDVAKPLANELIATIKQFFGPDASTSDSFGRIINERHFDRISRLLDPASHGGEVIYGGLNLADRSQKYIPPTLILNPKPDSPLMTEEIFGPVLPIITVSGPQDAIDFITARPHPLALYCFAEDQAVCDLVLGNTQSGGVCVNDTLFHITNPYLPFGGVGTSGMGGYHGEHGFKEMSHKRSVMYRSTWIDPGIRYPPYSDGKAKALRSFAAAEGLNPRTKKLLLAASAGAAGLFIMSKM